MDIYEQMKIRYGSTSYPLITSEPSLDNEGIAQWFFEVAFFKDFVYRNPDKKPDKEFCDALVIYDDTIIIVQIKTKQSKRTDIDWAKKNINTALSQLNGSYRATKDKLVTRFRNDLLNSDIIIDEKKHKSIYGMIIMAQDSKPYDPVALIDQNETPKIPCVICTVNDLKIIAERMDTSIDFITYFESRIETAKMGLRLLANDELENIKKVSRSLDAIYSRNLHSVTKEVVEKTVQLKREQMDDGFRGRDDYKFSLLIDDLIANAHDIDPAFSEAGASKDSKIPQIYSYLDRYRRIALGKKLYKAALEAQSSVAQIIVHIQKPIKRAFIYVYTKIERKARKEYLEALVAAAQIKYSLMKVTAVATEPIGMGGRSYDFYNTEEKMVANGVELPEEVMAGLPSMGDESLI